MFSYEAVQEVQVRLYLCRSWSLLGIQLQQVCHQMNGFRTGIWDQRLQITGNTLRPTEIHGTCQMVSLRPIVLEGEDTDTHLTHSHQNIIFNKNICFCSCTARHKYTGATLGLQDMRKMCNNMVGYHKNSSKDR